ncbi:MAG TPA: hypothetical protein VF997_14200, partial [Polyangia bacterium]
KSEAETQPTPITFKMRRGDPPFDIQLRADGYAPQTRTITSDESTKLQISLARLPSLAPKAELPPAPAPPQPKAELPKHAVKGEAAKTPTGKVSNVNVTKPKPKKPAPKSTQPDPDGIIQPSFGN